MPIPERVFVPQPKDTSKGHFYVSLVKSVLRFASATAFMFAGYELALPVMVLGGALLFAAELLGVLEELV